MKIHLGTSLFSVLLLTLAVVFSAEAKEPVKVLEYDEIQFTSDEIANLKTIDLSQAIQKVISRFAPNPVDFVSVKRPEAILTPLSESNMYRSIHFVSDNAMISLAVYGYRNKVYVQSHLMGNTEGADDTKGVPRSGFLEKWLPLADFSGETVIYLKGHLYFPDNVQGFDGPAYSDRYKMQNLTLALFKMMVLTDRNPHEFNHLGISKTAWEKAHSLK